MSNSNSYFSIIFVPPFGKKTRSLRISTSIFYTVIALSVLITLGLAVGFYYTSNTGYQLKDYKKLKTNFNEQHQSIQHIHTEIDELKTEIRDLIEKEDEIRSLLNKKGQKKRYRRKKTASASKKFERKFKALKQSEAQKISVLEPKITFLKNYIKTLKKKFLELSNKTQKYTIRFAATPSIWPIYGRILSDYGWRNHPVTRRRQFHKGVDIPSWIGASIRATADGIVTYTGWGGGYGLTIVIDHGHGFLSIYAHCSKLLTRQGALVKKGQTIANVGSSGLSTGPHVHYEIRKFRQAVNPHPYLDLDMFTASAKIW